MSNGRGRCFSILCLVLCWAGYAEAGIPGSESMPIRRPARWQQATLAGTDAAVLAFLPKTTGHRKILGLETKTPINPRIRRAFWVFYKNDGSAADPTAAPQSAWASSLSFQPFGVTTFLNSLAKNGTRVSDVEITTVQGAKNREFHIFYRTAQAPVTDDSAAWSWDYREYKNAQDAIAFLNGTDPESPGISSVVRATSFLGGPWPLYYVFFLKRPNALSGPTEWFGLSYKRDSGVITDGLNGIHQNLGWTAKPALDFEFLPTPAGILTLRDRNTKIYWGHVLNERLVVGSDLRLEAILFHWRPYLETSLEWRSSLSSQVIGVGNNPLVAALMPGTQTLIPSLGTALSSQALQVRAFTSLQELFVAEPSTAEFERLFAEFEIGFEDGVGSDEVWPKTSYAADPFDVSSNAPSKKVALNHIDLLRHTRFSMMASYPKEMLLEADLFRQIKRTTHKLFFTRGCGVNWAASGEIHFDRSYSQWVGVSVGTGEDSCKETSPVTPGNADLNFSTVAARYLFIHEARHNESIPPIVDPGHTTCNGSAPSSMDAVFQGGSGYAAAATFLIWTSQFGTTDTLEARKVATQSGKSMLGSRFCNGAYHSDPVVEAAIKAVSLGKTP